MAGRIDHYEVDKRYIHKDGATIWARLTVSTARSPKGDPLYVIAVLQDITEQKLAAERLAQAYAGLEKRVADRTRELSTLLEIVQAAGQSLDLGQVMQRVATGLASAVGVRNCGMYLWDEERGLFIPRLGTPSGGDASMSRKAAMAGPLDPGARHLYGRGSADPAARGLLRRAVRSPHQQGDGAGPGPALLPGRAVRSEG